MRELLFLNPAVRPGLNLTVRNGDKWANVHPGAVLEIKATYDAHGEPTKGKLGHAVALGHAIAAQVVNWPAMSSPVLAKVLRHSHDRNCRLGRLGRLDVEDALNRAYPSGWGPDVVLLWFWVS